MPDWLKTVLSRARERHRAMWRNFATSIGLLAIAMMAALYSSSAGQAGQLWPAGISGVIALAIVIWVGVRFVPRLAAGVDWDWLPFFSYYQVTREGWIYLGAVAIVVFAAVNTANNLLYMVLSALLAVLTLSGFLSRLNFRLLQFDVRTPTHCFAGEPFEVAVQAVNEKRLFPSFSLNVQPDAESAFRFPDFYIPLAPPQGRISQSGQGTLGRRGLYSMTKIAVRSRYPFGFFAKGRDYAVDAQCICYPPIIPLEQMNLSVLDIQGRNQRFERGPGYDLYTIRDYVPSDSARHVHWKASAKTATLKTREYAAEDSRRIVLAFDRFGSSGDSEKFEELVSQAASLAFHLIQDGMEVRLVSDEWQSRHGSTEALLNSILEYLALVGMSPTAPRPGVEGSDGAVMLSLR
jgi:uncharacterized protein (DUF58 family)